MRKTVLVTGASTGIGAATARLAARDGWDVAIHYRADREGAELTAKACEQLGAKTALLQADMEEPEAVAGLFAAFDAAFPRLDALVNNAGTVDMPARVEEMDLARLNRTFAINTISPMLAAAEAVRRMSTARGGAGGVIVNVTSIAARMGSANEYVDYAAAKGAMDSFNKGLSNEVAQQGIRVVALRPGITDTGIHARGGQPDRAERLQHLIPMARPGTPEELGESIVFLISDKASYITGTTIDVSGGR